MPNMRHGSALSQFEQDRERIADLLGVHLPAEDRQVWQLLARLVAGLLDELEYQDQRLRGIVHQQAEVIDAARSLLGAQQLAAAQAELRSQRAALLAQLQQRAEQLDAARGQDGRTFRERLRSLPRQRGGLSPAQLDDYGVRSAKLTTLSRLAERYSVSPRWLAFGEPEQGNPHSPLASRLRLARERAQLGQVALARRAKVSTGIISYLEAGSGPRGIPLTSTLDTIQSLAEALAVRPGWLAFGGAP